MTVPSASEVPTEKGTVPGQPPERPWRVLVAIHDEALRRECSRQLRRLSLQVVESTSPFEASQMCMAHGANLAVLSGDSGITAIAEAIRLTVFGLGPALVVTDRGAAAELPLGLSGRAIVRPVARRSSTEEWRRAVSRVWKEWSDFLVLWGERGSPVEALRLRASLRLKRGEAPGTLWAAEK